MLILQLKYSQRWLSFDSSVIDDCLQFLGFSLDILQFQKFNYSSIMSFKCFLGEPSWPNAVTIAITVLSKLCVFQFNLKKPYLRTSGKISRCYLPYLCYGLSAFTI